MRLVANLTNIAQFNFLGSLSTEQTSSANGRHRITALVTETRLVTGLSALTTGLRVSATHRLRFSLFYLVLGVLLALRAVRVSDFR